MSKTSIKIRYALTLVVVDGCRAADDFLGSRQGWCPRVVRDHLGGGLGGGGWPWEVLGCMQSLEKTEQVHRGSRNRLVVKGT